MIRKIVIGALLLAVVLGVGAFAYYQAMARGWIKYNEFDIRTGLEELVATL